MASNNNNTYEKGPLPTFTIVDSVDKQSSHKFRSCCVCLPERTGVIIIFSFYVLSGFLSSVASFFYLTLYPDTLDKVLLVISGILYALLCVSGASGLSFIRKDNAVMMNRLPIATWILTGLILTYNVTVYILEVVFKSSAVQQCQEDFNQGPDPNDDIDCNQAVNIVLVKDAMKLIFTELFSLYFSYVISRFSKKMLEDSKKPILPYSVDQDGPATPYTVYVTRPPTSHNWVPPPTYTVRANDVPSDTKNAPVLS